MRKYSALDALLPKVRQGILAATVLHPERWWYLSDLARHLHTTPSSLQRELTALVGAGILRRRQEGRQVYYCPDPDCPILPELQGLMAKTAGLGDVLRQALAPLADRITCAFVYGSLARGEARSDSDVDLMVIGKLGLADLAPRLASAEQQLGRPVNPTLYTRAEWARKVKSDHPFVQEVLAGAKLFLIGTADELAELTGH